MEELQMKREKSRIIIVIMVAHTTCLALTTYQAEPWMLHVYPVLTYFSVTYTLRYILGLSYR